MMSITASFQARPLVHIDLSLMNDLTAVASCCVLINHRGVNPNPKRGVVYLEVMYELKRLMIRPAGNSFRSYTC